MLSDLKNYELIDALGLSMWQPRAFRHPQLNAQATKIVMQPLSINVCCAVLLFNPQLESQKILDGMLSVLGLQTDQLMLIKIYASNPDLELVSQNLHKLNPTNVLQLSMDLPAVLYNKTVVRSFSPEYLLSNVQYKSQAYKDLLTLRKILEHGTSHWSA